MIYILDMSLKIIDFRLHLHLPGDSEFTFHVQIKTFMITAPANVLAPADAMLSAVYQLNTLKPRQNRSHFPDDIFIWIFFNEYVCSDYGLVPAKWQARIWTNDG